MSKRGNSPRGIYLAHHGRSPSFSRSYRKKLRESGWTEGRDLEFDVRWGPKLWLFAVEEKQHKGLKQRGHAILILEDSRLRGVSEFAIIDAQDSTPRRAWVMPYGCRGIGSAQTNAQTAPVVRQDHPGAFNMVLCDC